MKDYELKRYEVYVCAREDYLGKFVGRFAGTKDNIARFLMVKHKDIGIGRKLYFTEIEDLDVVCKPINSFGVKEMLKDELK